MAVAPDTDQETSPLWQFVTVADYRPPKASVKVVSENWLEQVGEVWRVAPRGYPVIRNFLEDERYFIDDF